MPLPRSEWLRVHAEWPALFSAGSYTAVAARGRRARHIVAFARQLDEAFAVVVAPRLVLELSDGVDRPLVPADR